MNAYQLCAFANSGQAPMPWPRAVVQHLWVNSDSVIAEPDAEFLPIVSNRNFVAWRNQPKWVVSRSLKSVGPNATLVANDVEAAIGRLKAELAGEIGVGGSDLARSLTEAGRIDEYRLYLSPVVLGGGKPFFAGPRPPLHLAASDRITEDVIRLTYVPA